MAARTAVKIRDTLFRVDEISWVKVRRLTSLERLARGFLLGSGALFLVLVCLSKGTVWSLEALLGLVPISFGAGLRGQYRVASSGDDEGTYLERDVQGHVRPAELVEAMQGVGAGPLEYRNSQGDYYYALRPERIAWARPWADLNLQPLALVALFGAYFYAVPRGYNLAGVPIIQDLKLLEFPGHAWGSAVLAATLVMLAACLAIAASARRGIEVASVGGLRDSLPLDSEDRDRVFLELASG